MFWLVLSNDIIVKIEPETPPVEPNSHLNRFKTQFKFIGHIVTWKLGEAINVWIFHQHQWQRTDTKYPNQLWNLGNVSIFYFSQNQNLTDVWEGTWTWEWLVMFCQKSQLLESVAETRWDLDHTSRDLHRKNHLIY